MLKVFPREWHSRHIHGARLSQDCHSHGCCVCPQAPGQDPLRFRWINNPPGLTTEEDLSFSATRFFSLPTGFSKTRSDTKVHPIPILLALYSCVAHTIVLLQCSALDVLSAYSNT